MITFDLGVREYQKIEDGWFKVSTVVDTPNKTYDGFDLGATKFNAAK